MLKKENLKLYAITDSKYSFGNEALFLKQVKNTLAGGATILQLREKDLCEDIFFNRAKKVKSICRKFGVPLIINDNVNIAKKIDADGIHIGQEDAPITQAKKILGKSKIIGVSVFNVKEAIDAEKGGATYLGVGSIFKTSSKSDAKMVNWSTLKEICENVKIPVVAIGGINEDNILKLKGSGISGIALISAIFSSKNIKESTRKYKKITDNLF